MDESVRMAVGERTAKEVIALLDSGRRVLIDVEIVGTTHEIALRQRDGVYYCDTPTTLYTHKTKAGIRECLEGEGYVAREGER